MRPASRTVQIWITATAGALLLGVLAPPLPAQSPEETATALFRETYTTIHDEALRPGDPFILLSQATAAIQQALTAGGADQPGPPVLTGQENDDLQAVSTYLQAAIRSLPPRGSETVIATALRAMVRVLSDPQGAVFTPSEFSRYTQELRGEHQSIGIQVDVREDGARRQIVVVDLTNNGPAKRAGVQVGDAILDVDGRFVADRTPDQVMDWLRGPLGSTVTLTVRQRSGTVNRLSIVRDWVRENPTRSKIVDTRIGYLRLLEFSESAHLDFAGALAELRAGGAAALVLDLRENGGGLLDEAVMIASFFLRDGVVAMEERRGQLVSLNVVRVDPRFTGPVVVLVSGYTASASEIVAGALQDTGSTLVGTKTFGKATVQTIFPLQAGWGLRITTARYYTRRGRAIDGVGLQPNTIVVMPPDQVQGPRDIQAQQALSMVKLRLETPVTRTRP